jgi:large exoprotein involved in heme utilization and adhesion
MLRTFRATLVSSAIGGSFAQMLLASAAFANPAISSVTTGAASIASSSHKTQIDQTSEDVVINWSSFNVGARQTTQFVQLNARAFAVNRIGY